MAKATPCSVYRTGGYYDLRWVMKLGNAIGFDRFALVSDWFDRLEPVVGMPRRLELARALVSDWFDDGLTPWPGWWYKMELFRPGLWDDGETVLYMDLDTLVVGDLTDLLSYTGDFAMIPDFFSPQRRQSGVMLFRAGSTQVEHIWKVWSADPEAIMASHRGDGEFIRSVVPDADRIEDLFPGQVLSFKRDALHGPPPNARLVCGHGTPKFDTPAAGWANVWWEALPE